MDEKHRDTVFSVILFVLGTYVVTESILMIGRATQPPLRIDRLSVSPGMLPLILGLALVFFSVLLAVVSLKGVDDPLRVFPKRLKTAWVAVRSAFSDDDFLIMLIGVTMMFIYCFFVVGSVPFWGGAFGFLLLIMTFLHCAGPVVRFARATRLGVIVLTALISVGLVVLLFENIFKTVLP
ncbi:MAG: tripartite tricarboxylate transporter TctB family protein [Candidatus Accumulibacter sp.]|jgi:hypothetical protein|nr:tripartite tricarboxylate transporter TctB family protein [Accumulibacter sp.]